MKVKVRIAFWLLFHASTMASAEAQPAPDRAAADSLFSDGLRLMREQRYTEACPKFEASQRLDPSYGALMNVGDCYEKVGRTASAWGAYREAADLARKFAEPNRVRLSETRAAALEPRLARLELVLEGEGDAKELEILRGGQRVDPSLLGTPLPIDPGEYEIVVRGPGYTEWRRTVRVAEPGRQVTERISLHRVEVARAEPTAGGSDPAATRGASGIDIAARAPTPAGPLEIVPFIEIGSAVGWSWADSSDISASVSGLAIGVDVLPGLRLGDRFVLLGELRYASLRDPTLTFNGQSASGDLTVWELSFGAGVGYRVAPALTASALVRLTKIGMSAGSTSLDSSLGPGGELALDWELASHGPWSVGLRAELAFDSVDVSGSSWSAKTIGIAFVGTYR